MLQLTGNVPPEIVGRLQGRFWQCETSIAPLDRTVEPMPLVLPLLKHMKASLHPVYIKMFSCESILSDNVIYLQGVDESLYNKVSLVTNQ